MKLRRIDEAEVLELLERNRGAKILWVDVELFPILASDHPQPLPAGMLQNVMSSAIKYNGATPEKGMYRNFMQALDETTASRVIYERREEPEPFVLILLGEDVVVIRGEARSKEEGIKDILFRRSRHGNIRS